ncbi:hypothetical protein [Mycolicibacter sinensis]|uniref:Uncharacterized protein n=1 Tax=Mycolicibacter sinensis (strain JDM601) TaxID=875328 RepID=A0A1A2Y620_MYCSD|nr:hypothetical protein [Mycolicibacter sinensis]OBI32853.1 hypothetical protein A5710_14405 [Mycolicibacter sinensis]
MSGSGRQGLGWFGQHVRRRRRRRDARELSTRRIETVWSAFQLAEDLIYARIRDQLDNLVSAVAAPLSALIYLGATQGNKGGLRWVAQTAADLVENPDRDRWLDLMVSFPDAPSVVQMSLNSALQMTDRQRAELAAAIRTIVEDHLKAAA